MVRVRGFAGGVDPMRPRCEKRIRCEPRSTSSARGGQIRGPRGDEALAELEDVADDPELAYLKKTYREEFRRVFSSVFAGVAPRELKRSELEGVLRLIQSRIEISLGA